jgi:hypothetical protein
MGLQSHLPPSYHQHLIISLARLANLHSLPNSSKSLENEINPDMGYEAQETKVFKGRSLLLLSQQRLACLK